MRFLKYFKTEFFYQEILWFAVAQFLGIFLVKKIGKVLVGTQMAAEKIGVFDFIIYFLIGTVLFVVFSGRSKISNLAVNLFFIFTLFFGTYFFLSLFVNLSAAFYFAASLIIVRFIFPSIFLHNLLFLLAIVSFSGVLSFQFDGVTMVILLAAFSVYDIISVYVTKHMVKMAKAMIESHLIFGFIIPEKIRYNFWQVQKAEPGPGMIFLGGGDVGLPLFLTANIAHVNLMQGIIVGMFAVLGMTLSYWLFVSQKFKKPMPALPPISMMTILGYLMVKIIWG